MPQTLVFVLCLCRRWSVVLPYEQVLRTVGRGELKIKTRQDICIIILLLYIDIIILYYILYYIIILCLRLKEDKNHQTITRP